MLLGDIFNGIKQQNSEVKSMENRYIYLEYIKLAMKGGAGVEGSVIIKVTGIMPSLQKHPESRDRMVLLKKG